MDLSAYLKAIDAADAVAFDIFDTLIVRPFVRPSDLFAYIEVEQGLVGFAQARMEAERRARRDNRETSLEGIYAHIDPRYAGLKDTEVELEVTLARADPAAIQVFRYAIEQGKTVVLVSDMYLSSSILERLVAKQGYSKYTRIYVSSEVGLSKHDGRMYDLLLGNLGLDTARVLMIGDNRQADIARARSRGLSAMRWVSLRERYFASHGPERRFLKRYPGYESSLLVGVDMLGWTFHAEESYWHRVSRRFGGPINVMFVRFIQDHAEDVDRLVFFSRDGYIPMLVYQLLDGRKPSTYLYTSRMTAKVFGQKDLSCRDTAVSLMAYMEEMAGNEGEAVPDRQHYRDFVKRNGKRLEEVMTEGHDRY